MLNPIKLWKSRKYVNEVLEDWKGVSVKNWTTTLPGIIIALLMLAKIWAPADYQSKINDTIGILTAAGFVAAKSSNVHSTEKEVEVATDIQSVKDRAK
jgi:hypothetical protein